MSICFVTSRYLNTLGNKKVELFDTGAGVSGEPTAEENVQMASCESVYTNLFCNQNMNLLSEKCVAMSNQGPLKHLLCHLHCVAMSNQELVDAGMKRMDETDQAIDRSKQVT